MKGMIVNPHINLIPRVIPLFSWMLSWNRRGGIVEFVDKTYKWTLLYISRHFISGHFVKSPRNLRVTSAEELGTMSKNNLREITVGIRPV